MIRKHPVRTALGVVTAVTVACGVAAFGPAAPAAAYFGEAEISPIESDISEKPWAGVEVSSGASTADLAIDQDDRTAWTADGTSADQWLTLDLGGAYDNVRKVEVVLPDAGAVYQYVIESSADGGSWDVIADHSADQRPTRGSVDLFTQPGTRFVRVTFTGASPGATAGISELSVYNYLRDDLVLGADASWVDNDVAEGRDYWVSPTEEDPGAGPHLLDVLQDRGMEYIRLRIFNEPRSESSGDVLPVPYQGPERSLEVAEWIKAERDMGLGIDFHYADSWADPSKQPKPREWAELEFDDLTQEVYDYTYDYVEQLIEQGTTPDKVAIGNEIINGFMFGSEAALIGTTDPAYFRNQPEIYQSQPGGGLLWQYWGSEDPEEQRLYDEAWDRFTTLSAAGIRAVRDVSADHGEDIDVETHIATGREDKALEFWHQYLTRVNAKGADPDVLAHSYYPEWHGSPENIEHTLNAVAAAHPGYRIEIAETSYPASGGGGAPMPNSTYPRTVQGQADALQRVFQIANDIPNNQGLGVLAWEPARWQSMFTAVPGMTRTWEPNASIDVFSRSRASHAVEDTVYAAALVGGEVALPDSVEVLTMADGSTGPVPVEWDPVPDGATDTAGRVTIHGSTEYGAVTAVLDVVDAYAGLDCDRVISGRHAGPLTVTEGVTCLDGATVSGPVSVRAGASLQADGAVIAGPVRADGAAAVVICDSRISGPVTSSGTSSVTIGDPVLGCAPNTISGPVTGTLWWNVIAGNTISGPLTCGENTRPPVNNGSANTVSGPKSAQCRDL
ncbi:glycosyl hydrolase 53 family protein [Streptomyces litchfieldiae]|uniref:Arabinogalactan endo-beta-1,4-galactanase n=1 Tax=Streptomyces litchfieldiae TaxID=3075543 RepID=A0ABU2MMR6_9ACTN|nr:glycosyl hydrolase 53 family protein [Streptomyces sp. DSM 44938]MDT0342835.1 glycosyl hydrolase 53 family protein [Streptomyces sp. DSM 44938]